MASSANFILKAYATEQNARDDSNPLAVNSLSAEGGSIVNNPSQAADYGFWAFQRYWYRIEANEPVTEFYIDWDDGENNSPEKANVSIIKNDKPSFFGITSHIYTQSNKFYPLIRVKIIEGFLSKWYTPHAGSSSSSLNTFKGLDDDIKTTANAGQIYDSGQNSFSVVSVERNAEDVSVTGASYNNGTTITHASNTNIIVGQAVVGSGIPDGSTVSSITDATHFELSATTTGGSKTSQTLTLSDMHARIPVFEPANVPPIGVLKTDRKRLFSNIDNDLISKDGRLLNGVDAGFGALPNNDTVTLWCDNAARTGVQVKVTYQEGIIGGVKAVASIQIVAKGPLGGTGQFYNQDLDDAAIFIKTMDAHYCCFWNADNRQSSGTAIPNFNPDIHTEVIATPTGNAGNTGVVTTVQVVTSMVNALNAVKFPATTGRTEFTATGTSDGDVEQITITNNREGRLVETGAWIAVQNNPLGNYPMDAAGYGTSGVRSNGTGEGAGVSPSGGNIKQKTLTNNLYKII